MTALSTIHRIQAATTVAAASRAGRTNSRSIAAGLWVDKVETPGLAEPSRSQNPHERIGKPAEGTVKPRPAQGQPDVRRVAGAEPRDQIVASLPDHRQGDDDPLRRRRGACNPGALSEREFNPRPEENAERQGDEEPVPGCRNRSPDRAGLAAGRRQDGAGDRAARGPEHLDLVKGYHQAQ